MPFLPTPPSHLLLFKSVKKQNLRQGRGADICRVDREGELNAAVFSPAVPRAVGGPSVDSPQRTRGRKEGKHIRPPWIYRFFFILNSSKIWPIMSWSPARLQPRGPSCLLLLSLCLPVMEMVNTLHSFISWGEFFSFFFFCFNYNRGCFSRFTVTLGSSCRVEHQLGLLG